MTEPYSRHIYFESVINFRDLGGYRARDGRSVSWRRLFRSGDFRSMTANDLALLTGEIGVNSVVDLRSQPEVERQGIGLLSDAGINYHNISFIAGTDRAEDERLFRECTHMGEFYLHMISHHEFGERIVAALEVIAEPANHPLVFHCAVGKDRTGILAAVLLGAVGVTDADIIQDYSLSTASIQELLRQVKRDPEVSEAIKPLPDYFWEATPESMDIFLAALKREHGSIESFLKAQGAKESLVSRLEKAVLD